MPTVSVALDKTQYVQVNTAFNPITLQSKRDTVRIVFSALQPADDTTAFHILGGKDTPLQFNSIDTNVWALSMSDESSLIVSETEPSSVSDFGTSVARGRMSGAYPYGSYGERDASSSEVNRVIWPNGTFTLPDAAGVQMSIVSTSADDDITGTNARTLEMHYIDSNGEEQNEFVNLDGTTPVLTTATDIRFINCLHIHDIGTNAYAAGDILASNSGIIYAQISANNVRCTSSMRMIPTGKVCYVAGAIGGAVSGTAAAKVVLKIVASELDIHQYIDPLILIPYGGIAVQDSSEAYNFPVPLKFSAGSVVGMLLTTDKAATVTGSWFGWLEDA
jgi:uncharacterized protein YqgC (DUF456 family)